MKRIIAAIAALLFATCAAHAQVQTKSYLENLNASLIPDNNTNSVSPANIRDVVNGVIVSMCGLGTSGDCPLISSLLASNNNWTGVNSFTGGIDGSLAFPAGTLTAVNGGPSATDIGLTATYSFTGTSNFVGTYPIYSIFGNDNAVMTAAANNILVPTLWVNTLGNTGFRGSRTAIFGSFTQNGKSGNACCGPTTGYGGGTFESVGTTNDNGTGLTPTTSSGTLTALVSNTILDAGATFWFSVQGYEQDISLGVGSSAYAKEGTEVVEKSTDAVQGSVVDCAFCTASQSGAVGWMAGLQFGNATGSQSPIAAAGDLINCQGPYGSLTDCGTVTNGINLANYIFTGLEISFPGFTVDNAGNIKPNGLTFGTGAAEQFLSTSANTGFGNQIVAQNSGTTTNSGTAAKLDATLGPNDDIGMFVNGGSTPGPSASILTGSGVTGGLTIQAGAGALTLVNANVSGTLGVTGAASIGGALTGVSESLSSTLLVDGLLTAQGGVLSNSPTGGIGYETGAGGVVTQATSKTTGVTLNTLAGTITMNGAALANGSAINFTLTDSSIAAGDVLVLNYSAGTSGAYQLGAATAAGSAVISVRNNFSSSLSEAVQIQFAVIKGATS